MDINKLTLKLVLLCIIQVYEHIHCNAVFNSKTTKYLNTWCGKVVNYEKSTKFYTTKQLRSMR